MCEDWHDEALCFVARCSVVIGWKCFLSLLPALYHLLGLELVLCPRRLRAVRLEQELVWIVAELRSSLIGGVSSFLLYKPVSVLAPTFPICLLVV